MPDPGYYGQRIPAQQVRPPRPPRPPLPPSQSSISQNRPFHSPFRSQHPTYTRVGPGARPPRHFGPRPGSGHGRGQGDSSARPPGHAESTIAAIASNPALPPDIRAQLRACAHAFVVDADVRAAGESSAMAASSSHATDISEPSEGDTYEIPDPNDEHDPFIQEEHDQLWQAAQDMDQHAWSPEQLNYIADQVHYSNSQNDYFGRNEDYDPNADEFDYFTLEPDSLNDLVDAPAIFDDDNYLMLSKDLKSKNISARTKLVGDSGASRFYFIKQNSNECLARVSLPNPAAIRTAGNVIYSEEAAFKVILFKRSADSVWALLAPGLIAPFPDSKDSPAVELASIGTLNSLGFDVTFKNSLFQSVPHKIVSAHNDSCYIDMVPGIGKLPLLDVLDPANARGKAFHSFYDDGPFSPARDAQIALKSAVLHGDRFAPLLRCMSESITKAYGPGPIRDVSDTSGRLTTPLTLTASHYLVESDALLSSSSEIDSALMAGHVSFDDADDSSFMGNIDTSNAHFGQTLSENSSKMTSTSPDTIARPISPMLGVPVQVTDGSSPLITPGAFAKPFRPIAPTAPRLCIGECGRAARSQTLNDYE